MANRKHLEILKQGVAVWNKWRYAYPEVSVDLSDADLEGRNLNGINLNRVLLYHSHLWDAKLKGASLLNADLDEADLFKADLTGANLNGAKLTGAVLEQANLSSANLTSADLSYANLVEAVVEGATLKDCRIYAVNVWALEGMPRNQGGLIITPEEDKADITVDNLQVAQFIYLLLNNQNVRNVIDTITTKSVLILGRFTPERKAVLDLVRQELSKYDFVPIIFDFENGYNQSLLETVMALAGMASFIIADITAATMVREELTSIVKNYPAKPVVPVMLHGETAYDSIKEMALAYKSILPIYEYKGVDDVASAMYDQIIVPAKRWLEDRRFQIEHGGKTLREVALEKQIEALQRRLEEKIR